MLAAIAFRRGRFDLYSISTPIRLRDFLLKLKRALSKYDQVFIVDCSRKELILFASKHRRHQSKNPELSIFKNFEKFAVARRETLNAEEEFLALVNNYANRLVGVEVNAVSVFLYGLSFESKEERESFFFDEELGRDLYIDVPAVELVDNYVVCALVGEDTAMKIYSIEYVDRVDFTFSTLDELKTFIFSRH